MILEVEVNQDGMFYGDVVIVQRDVYGKVVLDWLWPEGGVIYEYPAHGRASSCAFNLPKGWIAV